ncbi:hypothetical protein F5Y19DRAFT_469757 [Xylariaceae sp. FL1651]|nr:hypothetical protein F5Y19DRAFT_469757 [Xylariaceae sp. FL1651]
MSALTRAAARMGRVGRTRRLPVVTQKITTRSISWMAFEQPNPALYPSPPSLQPKRPAAIAVSGVDAATAPTAITRADSMPSTATARAGTQDVSASSKSVSHSTPAGARQPGQTPLSQIQKRTIIIQAPKRAIIAKSQSEELIGDIKLRGHHIWEQNKHTGPYLPTTMLCVKDWPVTGPITWSGWIEHAQPYERIKEVYEDIKEATERIEAVLAHMSIPDPTTFVSAPQKKSQNQGIATGHDVLFLLTTHIRLPNHPATWPMEQPRVPDQPRVRKTRYPTCASHPALPGIPVIVRKPKAQDQTRKSSISSVQATVPHGGTNTSVEQARRVHGIHEAMESKWREKRRAEMDDGGI